MKRILELTVLAGFALALPAADRVDERGDSVTSFTCSAKPGGSCEYTPVVDQLLMFRVSCSNGDAKPAPKVTIDEGPIAACSTQTSPEYVTGNCALVGLIVEDGPISVLIAAKCVAK